MKKIVFPILFSLAFAFCILMQSNAQTLLSKNVIRLHVIANSDTAADQAVKLRVRDALLDAFYETSAHPSKTDTQSRIQASLAEAEDIANHVLAENGFSYTARAEFGHFPFPVRQYGDVILPAGIYDSLRIHLGDASGQNWWCVMYPPLCLNSLNSKISQGDKKEVHFNIKFKCFEFFKAL